MNFRKLEVYKAAIRLLPLAVEIADALPSRYSSLADQLRRAGLSIPLNIAEGSGKTTGPDQRKFYAIARGSTMECAAIVDAAAALKLIDGEKAKGVDEILDALVRMLSRLCLDQNRVQDQVHVQVQDQVIPS